MIDLHSHLLPGMDDGAPDLHTALEMARIAAEAGTHHLVLTPHLHPGRWDNDKTEIAAAFSEFEQALQTANIPLALSFAAEVRLCDDLLRLAESDQIPVYGPPDEEGFRTFLLEFPHGQIIPGSLELVRWLADKGLRALIAHPERNRQVMRQPELVDAFLDQGCRLQVTAGALTGQFGERAQQTAHTFLESGRVWTIASDGHNLRARPPRLDGARDLVAERYGDEHVDRLFHRHPAQILWPRASSEQCLA